MFHVKHAVLAPGATPRNPRCAVLARGATPPNPPLRFAPARWYFADTPATHRAQGPVR